MHDLVTLCYYMVFKAHLDLELFISLMLGIVDLEGGILIKSEKSYLQLFLNGYSLLKLL